jgi:hypothetical protein
MKRGIVVLLLFILLFSVFMIACTQQTTEIPTEKLLVEKAVSSEPQISREENVTAVPEISVLKTACTSTWTCLSSTIKIYRYANCSFGEKQVCKYGCKNETCRSAPTCETGFKCNGGYARGHQEKNCEWTLEEKCPYGCKDGRCQPQPNETIVTESPASITPPEETVVSEPTNIIAVGQKQVVNSHNVSIYILEPTRVRMLLDERRSNWLEEGQNETLGNGVKIVIVAIYFQEYAGGKREVEYKLG